MLFMELKQFTKESVNKVKKYLKYIKDTDWTEIEVYYPGSDPGRRRINYEETIKQRKSEYLVQDKMALFAVNRIKTLTTRYKDFKRESVYKTFIKNAISMIDYHVERSQNYEIKIDVLEIENPDDKSTEMSFQQMVTDKYTAITDKLTSLDLSTDDNSTTFELFNGMRAPLVMHYVLVNLYPQIGRILKEKKIDFDSEPEPTIFILDENPPQWDPERHYFDQDRDTLQYYVDEWKKCRRGIVIDDTYISPWMYYHMNFFVTKYPTTSLNEMTGEEENKDVVGVPPLRDNEWFVISENYEEAKRKGQMMFIAATRRAGKSTMQASHLGHCVVDNKLELIVAGGSSKDLDVLQKNFEILQNNIHVAFRVPFIMETWNKRVEIGVRDKANKGILLSYLKIINMDGGAGSKSEVFAGITPDAVIIDEVMKLPFKSQIAGLMPAIDQPGGKRCVVFLAGTSGNDTLAKDAFEFLRNPTDNEVLDMPWDMLNKYVPEDCRTWQERPFGTFIPAQMSAKKGMNKKDSNLSEFLQRESESLSKIPIKVTDWCVAKDIVKEDREKKLKDLASYTKEVLYYPMCPSDMLLSTKINPFPVQEAVSHREYLKAKGGNGRRGYLSQKTDGTIVFELSEQPLAEYPFKGGFMDCPVVLYEDLPEETPADYLYVSSLDDYKQDESGTDSIGSFHIYKLDVGLDKNCGKIVASLATRPDPHERFHQQMYLLQQKFNAVCFMENADLSYKDFLERRRVADKWLCKSLDFEADLSAQSEGKRKFGWAPTPKNKKALFNKIVHYTRRIFQIEDEFGNEIDVLGINMIDDIVLLDEIIAYEEGKNVDRITSFMGCLGFEDYLNANYMSFNPNKIYETRREENRERIKKYSSNSFFRQSSGKFF